jgi:hypothetical protein
VIPQDKVLHFVVGFAGSLVIGLLLTPLWGFLLACTTGVGKEVYDKLSQRGTPELMDALATIAGGVLAMELIKGGRMLCGTP